MTVPTPATDGGADVNVPGSGSPPGPSDAALACWLAEQAAELLRRLRDERGYDDPAALRAEGDRTAHELIMKALARWRPADAVLSEEGKGSREAWTAEAGQAPARLDADRVWIIDPLDGTREFGEEGRTDWAVHIALWSRTPGTVAGDGVNAGTLTAAAVALPGRYRVLATEPAPTYPPLAPGVAAGGPLRIAASRSRPPAFLHEVAEIVGGELVPMGSAGAKIAAVIEGEVDAYLHAGGQYEWDSAAPVAVATATGLHASRIDGAPLEYNQANPRLPDLLVCRKDLAGKLLSALRKVDAR